MNALRSFFYRHGWDTRCRNVCPARLLQAALPAALRRARPAVLDVGSGELGLSAFLRGVSVVGLDLAPSHEPNGHYGFVRSTATALPFRDRAFPAVSCIDVLEHLAPAHRAQAIAECVRVASHVVVFAFPDGPRARACDQGFQEACRARARQVPAWVEEHLRHEYPVSEGVAEQVRQAAIRVDRRAQVTASACEPLAICRLVRAAESRSTLLYALCNLWFGFWAPLLRVSGRQGGYRTILVAGLSPVIRRSPARPLVSVVIPNFNYGRYLGQAIESVLGQSYPAVEVLVVDDGSTDHSRDVLRRYEGRIRVICQPRQGVSAARNRGVRESRGELVAFLDADDLWLPGKLERQVERLCAEPELGLVHCAAQLIDPAGCVLAEVTEGVAGRVTADLLQFRRSGVVTGGSGLLLPRAVFEEAGGFDPRLSTSADWDFFYRVGRRWPFGFLAEPLVQMRTHQANMRSNIPAMEHDMLLAFDKAFQDPALEVRRLRRRAYGTLHLVLAGSFFRAGRWEKSMTHAGRSVLTWPPAGVTMTSRLARRLMIPHPAAGGATRMLRTIQTGNEGLGTAAAGVVRHAHAAGRGPRAAGQRQGVR